MSDCSEFMVGIWSFPDQSFTMVSEHDSAAEALDCAEEKNKHAGRTHMYVATRAGEKGLMEEHLRTLKPVREEVIAL